jgi:hypothetical protein
MSATDFYLNPPTVKGYDFKAPTGINYEGFRPDLGNVLDINLQNLGGPSAPSPTQPGAQPGWGEQLKDFLGGVGKFGAGLGAGIAAARGDMPMAGQLISTYFQEKTGDKDESEESSLAKALRTLNDFGMISFKLKTDNKDTDKLMV